MPERLPDFLTPLEKGRLLAADMSSRDRAIITMFLYAGLRCNELRMLDMADIDFAAMTILVRHAKRKKQRLLPLRSETAVALEAYRGTEASGPVFLSRFNKRISNRRLRSLVKELGQSAGLTKDLHPHVLRHTFGTMLMEAEVNLEMIRDLLGHSNIKTTTIYAHCTVGAKRKAVDRL